MNAIFCSPSRYPQGFDATQLMLEGADHRLVNEVLFFCQAVGLPTTLAGIGCAGLSDELLAQVAELAVAPDGLIFNEPFPVTSAMVADAIRAADAAGRAFAAEA